MLVAFKPPAAQLSGDRLFRAERYSHFGDASHWLEPMRALARIAREAGIEFHTDDLVDLSTAAVYVFGDMPPSRRDLTGIRERYPHLKLILQIIETPLGRQWLFDRANHVEFDAVVSYNPRLNDEQRYFAFRIPAGGVGTYKVPRGLPFNKRKIACLIAQVPNVRPLLLRRSGIGMILNGWKFTGRTWLNYVAEGGSLYGERLKVARQCEKSLGDQFDIFGPGWPTVESSRGRKGFRCARGAFEGSKLDLLQQYRFTIAYENCRNDCGYISEKLFDAFLGGSVPVYLGNQSVHEFVAEDAFIDARRFRTRRHLVEALAQMPETTWRAMRTAAATYLIQHAPRFFGSDQYIQAMLGAIRQVTGVPAAPTHRLHG